MTSILLKSDNSMVLPLGQRLTHTYEFIHISFFFFNVLLLFYFNDGKDNFILVHRKWIILRKFYVLREVEGGGAYSLRCLFTFHLFTFVPNFTVIYRALNSIFEGLLQWFPQWPEHIHSSPTVRFVFFAFPVWLVLASFWSSDCFVRVPSTIHENQLQIILPPCASYCSKQRISFLFFPLNLSIHFFLFRTY